MDTLVARYSRPTYQQNELFTEQEQQDFTDVVPPLSLKFAMPPVAHVSFGFPNPSGCGSILTAELP
jgi:20S proteasome subunit beta 5